MSEKLHPDGVAASLLKQLTCEHQHRTGGNDYILCTDCHFEFDYRRESLERALIKHAASVLSAQQAPPTLLTELDVQIILTSLAADDLVNDEQYTRLAGLLKLCRRFQSSAVAVHMTQEAEPPVEETR